METFDEKIARLERQLERAEYDHEQAMREKMLTEKEAEYYGMLRHTALAAFFCTEHNLALARKKLDEARAEGGWNGE